MSQMPAEARLIVFEPNIEKTFEVFVFNSDRVESFVYPGPLEPYVTLIDDNPLGPPRNIALKISFPEYIEPGRYEIMFGGKEYKADEGTVSGTAAVASRITILSLFPGKYPEFSISAYDFPNGEKMNFSINVENFGTEDILSAYANIDIYDSENNFITTIKSTEGIVYNKKTDMKSTLLYAEFDSSQFNLKPGFFKGVATLYYDGLEYPEKKEASFRLGTLNVYIQDWTKQIYSNVTNKFVINIESDWSGTIDNVYARIQTPNGVIKTPNLDLNKFQTATLETYWEAKKLEIGNHTVTIEVFYASTSTKKDVVVEALAPVGPVEESPGDIPYLMIGGVLVLILLIAFNIYFFIRKPRASTGSSADVGSNSPSNKTGGVQPPKI